MADREPMVGALLRVPWQAVRDRLHTDLVAAGFPDLHPAHLQVFQYPGPDGALPSELAARARMSRQAMNHLLGQLEGNGYLTRTAARSDGRQRVVQLTERGNAALREILATLHTLEGEWRQLMGPSDYESLRSVLQRLNSLLAAPDVGGSQARRRTQR